MATEVLYFTYFLAFGSIVMQIGIVFMFLLFLFRKREWAICSMKFISENAFLVGFLLALGGTVGSLIYSEVFGYPPCEICWWQRTLLYPQVIILGVGTALRNKRPAALYSVIFSIAGLFAAVYHTIIQTFPVEAGFCAIDVVDCTEVTFEVLGFMTMPIMSATSFAFIALLSLIVLYREDIPWHERLKEVIKTYI